MSEDCYVELYFNKDWAAPKRLVALFCPPNRYRQEATIAGSGSTASAPCGLYAIGTLHPFEGGYWDSWFIWLVTADTPVCPCPALP